MLTTFLVGVKIPEMLTTDHAMRGDSPVAVVDRFLPRVFKRWEEVARNLPPSCREWSDMLAYSYLAEAGYNREQGRYLVERLWSYGRSDLKAFLLALAPTIDHVNRWARYLIAFCDDPSVPLVAPMRLTPTDREHARYGVLEPSMADLSQAFAIEPIEAETLRWLARSPATCLAAAACRNGNMPIDGLDKGPGPQGLILVTEEACWENFFQNPSWPLWLLIATEWPKIVSER